MALVARLVIMMAWLVMTLCLAALLHLVVEKVLAAILHLVGQEGMAVLVGAVPLPIMAAQGILQAPVQPKEAMEALVVLLLLHLPQEEGVALGQQVERPLAVMAVRGAMERPLLSQVLQLLILAVAVAVLMVMAQRLEQPEVAVVVPEVLEQTEARLLLTQVVGVVVVVTL